MSGIPKSSPALDAAINSVTDVTQLREKLLQQLASENVIVRTRDDEFNNRLLAPTELTPAVVLPATTVTCMRVLYPSGNDRYEIYGASETELDQKEAAIRNAGGGTK